MITRNATIVSILMASWWLYAQASAPVLVSVQTSGAGSTTLAANNTAPETVTAFLVDSDLSGTASAVKSGAVRVSASAVYDAATEPLAAKPLAPNEVTVLPYLLPPAGAIGALSVSAVLFADGTSWGDANSVARLTQRRAYMRQYLVATISDLARAVEAGTTATDLVAQFKSAVAVEMSAAANADQKACDASVRGLVLRNLQRVTQGSGGSPIPVSQAAQRELLSLQTRLVALQSYAPSNAGSAGAK